MKGVRFEGRVGREESVRSGQEAWTSRLTVAVGYASSVDTGNGIQAGQIFAAQEGEGQRQEGDPHVLLEMEDGSVTNVSADVR